MPNSRSYKVEGAALAAFKRWWKLEEQLSEQARQLEAERDEAHDEMWTTVTQAVGLNDPKGMTIDAQYFEEHGLVFLRPEVEGVTPEGMAALEERETKGAVTH